MSYEIYFVQEIHNIIGSKPVVVNTLTVNDGYISHGGYHVPLSSVLFIKEV